MSQFSFITDAESEAYCLKIANSMVQQFDMTQEEALGRINQAWVGQSFLGPLDLVYHEMPGDWAQFIYYKPGVHWWLEGADLSPRKYP